MISNLGLILSCIKHRREFGYKKPPKDTRFKKGGQPRGKVGAVHGIQLARSG
jgi:hypothetical protein